jgi:hypothetical protein
LSSFWGGGSFLSPASSILEVYLLTSNSQERKPAPLLFCITPPENALKTHKIQWSDSDSYLVPSFRLAKLPSTCEPALSKHGYGKQKYSHCRKNPKTV